MNLEPSEVAVAVECNVHYDTRQGMPRANLVLQVSAGLLWPDILSSPHYGSHLFAALEARAVELEGKAGSPNGQAAGEHAPAGRRMDFDD